MKTIIKYLGICISILSIQNAKAQWYQVNSGTTDAINDMYFADSLNGFGIAGYGKILKTSDGGENWNVIFQDTLLYHDQSLVTTNDSVFCFGKDFFGNANKITFHKNSNTHLSQTINFNVVNSVFFNNEIWDNNRVNASINSFFPGTFIEEFKVVNNYISASTETKVFFSDDFGQSWQSKQFKTSPLSSGPYQSYYDGSDTILAITNYPTVLHSSFDKGSTWNSIHTSAFRFYYFLNRFNIIGLWVVSDNKIYYSTTGGQSFAIDSVSQPVNNCYFYSNKIGFVFGENGVIYKTINGGGTLAVNELKNFKKKIRIYPNPAKESISIDINKDLLVKNIKLYDLHGNKVKEFLPSDTILKLHGIVTGQYILSVETDKGTLTEKIIKD